MILLRMNKKPKLRLYRTIKDQLCRENFLMEMKREEFRQLVMLRSGTNCLEIEKGRWRREKIEDRTCMVCMSDSVEDEEHFLLGCPMYASQRAQMFEEIRRDCFIDLEKEEKTMIVKMMIGSGREELDREIRKIVVYIRSNEKKKTICKRLRLCVSVFVRVVLCFSESVFVYVVCCVLI